MHIESVLSLFTVSWTYQLAQYTHKHTLLGTVTRGKLFAHLVYTITAERMFINTSIHSEPASVNITC